MKIGITTVNPNEVVWRRGRRIANYQLPSVPDLKDQVSAALRYLDAHPRTAVVVYNDGPTSRITAIASRMRGPGRYSAANIGQGRCALARRKTAEAVR